MDWQPIETAPKDGTIILVNDTQVNCSNMALASWHDGKVWSGWIYGDDFISDDSPRGPCPTHWVDIPPPPVKEK